MGVTASQISALSPDGVLALGDNQYEYGPLAAFNLGYDQSWGAFKNVTHPVPGNHEYGNTTLQQPFTPCDDPPQSGYFSYFGARAGDASEGYYSFDLGAWHIVALNSECGSVGGCGAGSPQETWLEGDLAGHP
ncbi:MAG: alkaline phosphatase, partial [Actinomycetota bacterium]|nr:alkaline phosphatase [Actinomycetota bacterium]